MNREKPPNVTEIVYRWGDGREEVRYRRAFGSQGADALMLEVDRLQLKLGKECPYFYRHVTGTEPKQPRATKGTR